MSEHDKICDAKALYNQAYAYYEDGDRDNLLRICNNLIMKFPHSKEAKWALKNFSINAKEVNYLSQLWEQETHDSPDAKILLDAHLHRQLTVFSCWCHRKKLCLGVNVGRLISSLVQVRDANSAQGPYRATLASLHKTTLKSIINTINGGSVNG